MKKHYYLTISLVVCMALVLSACGDDKDEKDDTPKGKVARVDTYTISPAFVYGIYLVNHPKNNPWVETIWSESGVSFHFYVSQNNSFTDIGSIHSKETSIASADRKKPIHVDVPIPASIDVSKPYQVIAMGGSPTLSNGNIVYDVELNRDDPYVPKMYVAQGGSNATSQAMYLCVDELLYITNNTGKSIKVKHLGYETTDKWYSKKGKVGITPILGVNTSVESINGEVESKEKTIKAGEEGFFSSIYVPSGKKMTNAKLVLEIDGKKVTTPAVSSDVSIENGIPAFMNVKWDGQNLEWD